jgi:hypothetical protein
MLTWTSTGLQHLKHGKPKTEALNLKERVRFLEMTVSRVHETYSRKFHAAISEQRDVNERLKGEIQKLSTEIMEKMNKISYDASYQ